MADPADVIDTKDPGDEVIRRFRFQIGYTALKVIALVDPDSIGDCIYCEQVEDLLIALKAASYIGIQIKSRELDQPPLKAGDAAILATLARFCAEDARFPGNFAGFCLVTNYSFFRGDGGDCIERLIECARTNPSLTGLKRGNTVKKRIEEVAAAAGVTVEQAVAALAKLELEEMRTALDLDLQVVQALSELENCRQLRYVQILTAARLLQARLLSASSKAHLQNQTAANAIALDIAGRTKALTLANKRVAAAIVHECIAQAGLETATHAQELLAINGYVAREGSPAGLRKMEAKMSAGELTVLELEQFKDDVRGLEAAFLRWKEKYDLTEANTRLQHIQQLAIQQCRKLHDARVAPAGFKHPVVTDVAAVRKRMGTVASEEAANLFGCRAEHLRGAVGMLTDECRVWWSEPFDVGSVA